MQENFMRIFFDTSWNAQLQLHYDVKIKNGLTEIGMKRGNTRMRIKMAQRPRFVRWAIFHKILLRFIVGNRNTIIILTLFLNIADSQTGANGCLTGLIPQCR